MNGQQRAVLWIGLILVGLNLVSHWTEIVGVIFNGAGITSGIPTPSSGGGFQIPDPLKLLPGVGTFAPGTITLAKTTKKNKSGQVV